MILKINKRLYNFIIIFIYTFGTDVILKLIRGSHLFNWAVFRILLSSIIISYIVSYIFTKFRNKTAMILNMLFCFAISLYALLQLGFFEYVGTYMSFKSGEQAYKVLDFMWDFISSIDIKYYLQFIPLALLLIYYFLILPLLKKYRNFDIYLIKDDIKKSKWIKRMIKVSVVLFLIFIYYITLITPFMQSKYQFEKNIDLFLNPENQSVAIDQLGVTIFFITDLNSSIFNYEPPIEDIKPIKKPVPSEPETDYTRHIDDSLWLRANANEKNNRIKQLNNYFLNRNITPKNDYTGILKDKNVIFIMMESVSLLGINEEYFPNIYKLWNEGISFSNFYSPRNSCPTGNNEMTSMVGLYTINNSCTANAYRKNTYPQAVFNIYKNAGYYVSSYHNYIDQYYYRGQIHRNAGSEKYYNANALKIRNVANKNWPSDVELFEKGLPHFINEDKFMSFMTTVTAHAPYHLYSEYGEKNRDLFNDLKITTAMKRYYSKVYETDLGIKYLLEELERTGKLDDTVLVLFGDHQPYALGVKQQVDILGEEAGLNKNIEKTPFIIYNSQLPGMHIEKYVSIIDILPTILNLFDLEHDPRFYMGEDVFNDNVHHRAIFTDGSWQDEVGFFNASTDSFILSDPENLELNYTDEEILEINTEINQKQKMSTMAIKNNYFYYRDSSIQKIKNK